MKVAVFADIHGNLPALEAVWAHARALGAEDFWNLGDNVGYGPFPSEVLAFLRENFILSLQGNYDAKVLRFAGEKDGKWLEKKRPEKSLAFRWAWENLTPLNREYLSGLPGILRLRCGGHPFFLCHGSPDSSGEHLDMETSEERLIELGEGARGECVLCGHSHVPFDRLAGRVRFINPGSVGRPDDGDPRASYCLLDIQKSGIRASFHRVGYDVDQVLSRLREAGLPDVFGRIFLQGENLDAVLQGPGEERNTAVRAAILDVQDEYVDVRPHAEQVAALALSLFDWLRDLHGYGSRERELLEYAALLHDIGWSEGRRGHHKTSRKLIMEIPDLPFSMRQRRLISSIARYHRRSLPSTEHHHYASLDKKERALVCALGSLLRIADGLDYSALGLVEELSCALGPEEVRITCTAEQPPQGEDESALRKSDLFMQHFEKRISLEWLLRN